MKLIHFLFVVCFCMAGFPCHAATFTASQARQAVEGATALELVYTHRVSAQPMAYVFSKGPDKGFVIMTAKGYEPVMLGYTDDGNFDPGDIPPALAEMMEMYSPEYVPSPQSRAEKAAVDPLCSTMWGQEMPYNYYCPIYDGRRSVTGCSSTAMAQVMKYYEYPARGRGYNSYTYTYNNQEYTLSQDFSQANIRWSQMQDFYSEQNLGLESEKAVAELMKWCGLAANSVYSPENTSSNMRNVLIGLGEYFDYDHGMSMERRVWYEDEAWNDLIYNELSNGRPVLYRGQTFEGEGHIFVCDGYAGDGYFHINWGWRGHYNGNFLLSALCVEDHVSYSFGQMAGIGLKPNAGGKNEFFLFIGSELNTDKVTYSRTNDDPIYFSGGFYNGSLSIVDLEIGVKLSNEKNTEYIYLFPEYDLNPNHGWKSFYTYARLFRPGEYDVYPVARRIGETEWKTMKCNVEYNNFVHFVVTDSDISVSYPDKPMNNLSDAAVDDSQIQYYNLQGVPVLNPENGIFIKVQGFRRTKVSF